jgi:glycosyltransferase involved in cell wall biosynthesis
VYIGLPVYNGDRYLADALDCLLAQTHRDFTVLISDNASTDATGAIGRDFARRDPRIIYHRHLTNLGAAPNFNFCVAQANGTYFKWMAHDDLCLPTYLERCVDLLDRDPGAVLCHARVTNIDSAGAITGSYSGEWTFNDPDPAVRFARAMALDHSCVTVFGVIRLDVLKQTPAIAPFVGSDRPLLAELALHGRLEYVPEELFLWREHPNRSVRLQRRDRLAWFDTSARSILSTLIVQQLWANQRAALRTPRSYRDKARAFGKTLQWGLKNRGMLLRDIRAMAGSLLRRLMPAGARAQ